MEESQTNLLVVLHQLSQRASTHNALCVNTEVLPVILLSYLPGLRTVLYWYEVLV